MEAPPPQDAPPESPKVKPKKKKDKSATKDGKKKKKKKKDAGEFTAAASAPARLSARARARLLCRVMELRISITRYYSQEAQYMDRVRSRVAMHLGGFHESGEWRYGRKVLSALDSLAVPRETPDELRHDLDLLHKLEATLDDRGGAQSTPLLKDPDVPDDDLPELAICLREEIENLRGSVEEARRHIQQLEARAGDRGLPPPPQSAGGGLMPPAPPG